MLKNRVLAKISTNKKGDTIVEDTKGFRTEVYKLKKKIFEYKYPDLEIREVRKEEVR